MLGVGRGARTMRPNRATWVIAAAVAAAFSGCASPRMLDKTYRTDKLREVYPAGITSREDVQTALQTRPELSFGRPEMGWAHHASAVLSRKMPAMEEQIGKEVFLVERYLMPDPRSSFDLFSVCNLWFYYDAGEKLVDVEWEWHTD